MEIFFAINNGYTDKLCVCLVSLLENNKNKPIHIYVMSSDLDEANRRKLQKIVRRFPGTKLDVIVPDMNKFKQLKLNIDYISIETYFRYLIAELLPNSEKALYLDADLVVNGSLEDLWNTPLDGYYVAGVKDGYIEEKGYKTQIGLKENDLYINAGVLLLNLSKIRQDNKVAQLFEATEGLQGKITFQDQDVINIVFNGQIKELDSIYNFMVRNVKKERGKRKSAIVIHYNGRKKPWSKECRHKLKNVWQKYADKTARILERPLKVGLIIDEFFGGAGTAFGGYGFLARKYICRYIPDDDIQIDVLLGKNKKKWFKVQKYHEDEVELYRLPKCGFFAKRWLKKQDYDIYLSIELVSNFVLEHEPDKSKQLILWIQDPRPLSAWQNVIGTMQAIKDPCFFRAETYKTAHKWAQEGRVRFVTQGNCLISPAMELYDLPMETPVKFLPNPIEIDFDFKFDINKKKKQVIFLGRLEAQKRAWIYCEIAKRMPEYEFYVLGGFFRFAEENKKMLAPYMNGQIKNLHFMGHVDGEEKQKFLEESRIMVNTAIWEGIPISWLEVLSYGTAVVSAVERENLAGRFGGCVGDILGDGFDGVDKFIPVIRELMENDELYSQKAKAAIEYIRQTHNIERFTKDLREEIYRACA